jgi:gliding motility-associated-like protein
MFFFFKFCPLIDSIIFTMRYLAFFFLSVFSQVVVAQTTVGLVAYYQFEGNAGDATGNSSNTGTIIGAPDYPCGVQGAALRLDGADDRVTFLGTGNVNGEFDSEDISISFYINPVGDAGTQHILSKRSDDCDDKGYFYIRYAPGGRTINVYFGETAIKNVSLVHQFTNTACWQHVTVVREGLRVKLYANGRFIQSLTTTSRINILNTGMLTVGGGNCLTGTDIPYQGLIDELRIYNRALKESEIRELYFSPDMIVNRDTTIYLGSSIDIELTNNCATSFSWSPAGDVAAPTNGETRITPSAAGEFTYTLEMNDNIASCIATDTFRLRVVDPDDLDCRTVFFPKAFTPNNDGLNDTYGISNPFAIQQLVAFERFDRWGGRVFYTEDPFLQWDGFVNGQAVNSGVFLYRVRWLCNNIERLDAGSLTVLR